MKMQPGKIYNRANKLPSFGMPKVSFRTPKLPRVQSLGVPKVGTSDVIKPVKLKKKRKNWIAGAIKHPGALHRQMGVKQGQKIPKSRLQAAASRGGKLGQRARLALTLSRMHHKKHKGTMCKVHKMVHPSGKVHKK